tara:strand:+ start:77 stop:241 length:165 start_codon:yes stop_codon:yes gene_type:complete
LFFGKFLTATKHIKIDFVAKISLKKVIKTAFLRFKKGMNNIDENIQYVIYFIYF